MRVHSQQGHKSDVLNILFKSNVAASTRVAIGTGALQEIDRIVAQCEVGKRVALLTQQSTKAAYADPAAALLAKSHDCRVLTLPDGEGCKSQDQLLNIWAWLQEMQMERSDCLLAIGGGALTDVAGFAAATYLRGIKLILVPTTLLGQVDAAIGGKTGINLAAGKNLAGTFYFPEAVIVDPATLSTLPEPELLSGLGEIIKYALIEETVASNTEYRRGPKSLLSILQNLLNSGPFSAHSSDLEGIIAASIKMKLAVVGKDPTEKGLRRCLNLGHTLGHAIEKVSHYEIRHGEAVAIGSVFACRLAEKRGRLPSSETASLIQLLEKSKLPTAMPATVSKDAIKSALSFDKKLRGGLIRFILPTEHLGTVEMDVEISPEQLAEAL
jgi:3-dehydroquinate synthase